MKIPKWAAWKMEKTFLSVRAQLTIFRNKYESLDNMALCTVNTGFVLIFKIAALQSTSCTKLKSNLSTSFHFVARIAPQIKFHTKKPIQRHLNQPMCYFEVYLFLENIKAQPNTLTHTQALHRQTRNFFVKRRFHKHRHAHTNYQVKVRREKVSFFCY